MKLVYEHEKGWITGGGLGRGASLYIGINVIGVKGKDGKIRGDVDVHLASAVLSTKMATNVFLEESSVTKRKGRHNVEKKKVLEKDGKEGYAHDARRQ